MLGPCVRQSEVLSASCSAEKDCLLFCFLKVRVCSTVKFIRLRLLVPRWPVRRAVPYGEEVVVTRNVAVPRQVVWILEVTGTPTASVLDHADSGLWGSKEHWVTVTSSAPKTNYSCILSQAQNISFPKHLFPLQLYWQHMGQTREKNSK